MRTITPAPRPKIDRAGQVIGAVLLVAVIALVGALLAAVYLKAKPYTVNAPVHSGRNWGAPVVAPLGRNWG